MLSTDQARRLVDAQSAARGRAERATSLRVSQIVAGFRGWWSDAEVDAMARQIVLVVEAGQTQTARLTDAYLNRVIGQALGRPVPPVGVPIAPEVWRSVPHVEAYSRPASDVRRLVAEGASLESAQGVAAARVDAMVLTDLALSMTNSARTVFETRGNWIDGYRRVIHPERSKSGTCGLCAVASDQVYASGDLLPIHARCKCEVLPIVNGVDPARDLNDTELRSLYDAAGSSQGADLKRIRIEVTEHGEIGPVLSNAKHATRKPSQVTHLRPVLHPELLTQSQDLTQQAIAAFQAGDEAAAAALRAQARELRIAASAA